MTSFKRIVSCAALGLAALCLSGCDKEKAAGRGVSAGVPKSVLLGSDSKPLRPPEAFREALAASESPAPSDGEGLAQKYRASFDGDARSLGGLADSLPVRAASRGGTLRNVRYTSEPRKWSPRGPEPPFPAAGTLPKVELPKPEPGAGPRGGGPVLLAFDAFQQELYRKIYPLLSRLGWGAARPKRTPSAMKPYRVTVHHTDGPQTMNEASTIAAVRNIQWYHMAGRHKEGKDVWDDIGYHFLIDGQGRVIEGRSPDAVGAHAGGANEGNIGVALLGDFNKVQPTQAQIDSLRRLVIFLALKYRSDPGRKGFLEPHMHFTNTDCPGKNVVALLDALRQEIDRGTDEMVKKLKPGAGLTAGVDFQPLVVTQPPS